MNSLYLSRSVLACFEGEGEGGAVPGPARVPARVPEPEAGRARGAGGGGGAAGEGRFTQEDLNRFLAEDRRKHQTQLQKMESQLNERAKSKSLTEQERQTLKENLDTIFRLVAHEFSPADLETAPVGGAVPSQGHGRRRSGRRRGRPSTGIPPCTSGRCRTPP